MKKITALLLALLMVFTVISFAVLPAFAEGETEQKQIVLKETFTAISGSRKIETVKKDFITADMACWNSDFNMDFRTNTLHIYANEESGAVIEKVDIEVGAIGYHNDDLLVKAGDSSEISGYHYTITVHTKKAKSKNDFFHITDINQSDILIGGNEWGFKGYNFDVYYRIDADKLTDEQLQEALDIARKDDECMRCAELEKIIDERKENKSFTASLFSGDNISPIICIAEAVIFAVVLIIVCVALKKKKKSA